MQWVRVGAEAQCCSTRNARPTSLREKEYLLSGCPVRGGVTSDLPGPAADQNGVFDSLLAVKTPPRTGTVPTSVDLSGGWTGLQLRRPPTWGCRCRTVPSSAADQSSGCALPRKGVAMTHAFLGERRSCPGGRAGHNIDRTRGVGSVRHAHSSRTSSVDNTSQSQQRDSEFPAALPGRKER